MESSNHVKNHPLALLSHMVFKILGLAPFRIKTNRRHKRSRTFSPSKIGFLYNIILTVVVVVLSPTALNAIRVTEYANKTLTFQVIALAKGSLGTTVLIIVWLYFIHHQQNIVRIANAWDHADNIIGTLEHATTRNLTAFQLSLYFAINIVIWINIIWTDLIVFEKWFKMTFVVITLPSFIFTWLILQYTFVLILLGEKFRTLNETLERISSTAFAIPYYFNASENDLEDIITRDLVMIKESHQDLHEITCDISNLYSFPIFLVISVFCATIIVSSYYFVLVLMDADHVEPFIILNSVWYLSMETFPIMVLSFGVNKITNEMKFTAIATHKLLTRAFIKPELKSQLKLFSLELLHKNVAFTAYNIFSLDGTLLHSILNTTATYLIILFQFGR